MKIYLARHGMTNYNELGLCNADPSVDVHLSETGLKQATALAEQLKDKNFELIYVSELKRTQQTAEPVNATHQLEIIVDSRLNDNKTGFEGKTVEEFYQALKTAPDKWSARFNDGESLLDTKARVQSFVDELKTKPYDAILAVTSMSVVQAFCSILNGLTDDEAWDLEVEKGSCIELELK